MESIGADLGVASDTPNHATIIIRMKAVKFNNDFVFTMSLLHILMRDFQKVPRF